MLGHRRLVAAASLLATLAACRPEQQPEILDPDAAVSGDAGSDAGGDAGTESDARVPAEDAGELPMDRDAAQPEPDAGSKLEIDLPKPDRGACAFLQPLAASPTANKACPMGVLEGDAIIHEAADLSALEGCTRITGDLVVDSPTLSELAGLDALLEIDGSLLIYGRRDYRGAHYGSNQLLESLHGLEQLRCVGRGLFVGQENICKPLDLGALAQLVEVGGTLTANNFCDGARFGDAFTRLQRVWGDANIKGPKSLPKLEQVYGSSHIDGGTQTPKLSYVGCGSSAEKCRDGILGCSLDVLHQSELAELKECQIAVGDLTLSGEDIDNLQALAKLREVRGFLGIRASKDGPMVPSNDKLSSLEGLEGLEQVHALGIGGVSQLQSLQGLSKLSALRAARSVAYQYGPKLDPSTLRLSTLPELRDLSALTALQEIQGTLLIDACDKLGDLNGLTDVKLFGLYTVNNAALHAINGPKYQPALTNVTFKDLPALKDIAGLEAVEEVGDLAIDNCAELADLGGLSGLKHATNINLSNNAKLASLAGLEALQRADYLFLTHNALTNLHGLTVLEQMQVLDVREPTLTTFEGLDALSAVSRLRVFECNALTQLTGLGKLANIGSLELISNAELTSMMGLSGVEQIGELIVRDHPKLSGFEGLSKVDSISNLTLEALPSVTSLAGLQTLHTLDVLSVTAVGLTDLQGLSAVSKLSSLAVSNMQSLQSLQGLEGLAAQDQSFSGLTLSGNPQLHDIHTLARLTKTGSLTVTDNPALLDLTGLDNLTQVDTSAALAGDFSLAPLHKLAMVGDLNVKGAASHSLAELSNLHKLGYLFLEGGGAPASLSGPPALETLFYLSITGSTFTDLKGLSALHGTIDSLVVTDSPNLTSLDGLQGLDQITQSMNITGNAALTSLTGLDHVHTSGQITIAGQPQLQNVDALASLNNVKVLGIFDGALLTNYHGVSQLTSLEQLRLGGAPLITSLSDFSGLTSLQSLLLTKQDGLTDLTGLSSMHSLIWLELTENAQLASLNGLETLTSVDTISIVGNPVLHDLRGLRNATQAHSGISSSTLSISGNTNLFECEVVWLANHLGQPVPANMNGPEGTCP